MESNEQFPEPANPTTLVVKYLETHAYVTARTATEACGCQSSNAARWLLQTLVHRGVLERDYQVERGPRRYTRGPCFDLWRGSDSRGVQPGIMAGPRPPAPILPRPLLPDGVREPE